ncbi:hypothetical protein [Legionella sp. 227]
MLSPEKTKVSAQPLSENSRIWQRLQEYFPNHARILMYAELT